MEQSTDTSKLTEQMVLINKSYKESFNDTLVPFLDAHDLVLKLHHAPYPLFAYDGNDSPKYTYMNLAAQRLFKVTQEEVEHLSVTETTAETLRKNLLNFILEVKSKKRYVSYSGLRITTTGEQFRLENAYLWAIYNNQKQYIGQGCMVPLF